MRKTYIILSVVCVTVIILLIPRNETTDLSNSDTIDSYDKSIIESLMNNSIPEWFIVNEYIKDVTYIHNHSCYFNEDEMIEAGVIYLNDSNIDNLPSDISDEICAFSANWIYLDITIRKDCLKNIFPKDTELERISTDSGSGLNLKYEDIKAHYLYPYSRMEKRIELSNGEKYQLCVPRTQEILVCHAGWGKVRVILSTEYTEWDI